LTRAHSRGARSVDESAVQRVSTHRAVLVAPGWPTTIAGSRRRREGCEQAGRELARAHEDVDASSES
jgi:hypothetical protein